MSANFSEITLDSGSAVWFDTHMTSAAPTIQHAPFSFTCTTSNKAPGTCRLAVLDAEYARKVQGRTDIANVLVTLGYDPAAQVVPTLVYLGL